MNDDRLLLAAALLLAFPWAVYGTAGLLSFSRILARPRAWACGEGREAPNAVRRFLAAMLSCMFCTGVWVGGVYGTLPAALGILSWSRTPLAVLLSAMAGAACSYLLDLVARRLEAGLE